MYVVLVTLLINTYLNYVYHGAMTPAWTMFQLTHFDFKLVNYMLATN